LTCVLVKLKLKEYVSWIVDRYENAHFNTVTLTVTIPSVWFVDCCIILFAVAYCLSVNGLSSFNLLIKDFVLLLQALLRTFF